MPRHPLMTSAVVTHEAIIDASWTGASPTRSRRLVAEIETSGARTVLLCAGSEVSVAPACPGSTAWWEQRLLEAGFRKSPRSPGAPGRYQRHPGGEIVRHAVRFERLPPVVAARYPLARLAVARDLHMDMLREAGARSDAHLARYRLAAGFVVRDAVVVDAACGLGYGAAILAATTRASTLLGVDASEYAITYGRTAWQPHFPNLALEVGDVRTLPMASSSADLVVSFETLEHLEESATFLTEVRRVLRPGGWLVGSVPNLWVDASGRDPSPYHLQVFDRERLLAALSSHFEIRELWQQNAAHDADGGAVPARCHAIGVGGRGGAGKPEWLLFAAARRT